VGFLTEDVPPSPNDQNHDTGEFVEESMNWTFSGVVPEVTFDTNEATGTESFAYTGVKNIIPRMMRISNPKDSLMTIRLPFDRWSQFSRDWIRNDTPSV
jgi:hypothetical protein